MRSTNIVFIACFLFVGAMASLIPSTDMQNCLNNIPSGCNPNVASCMTDFKTYTDCVKSKCSSAADFSAYGACITGDCKSSNSDVQAYAEAVRTCVYSSVLGLSVVLLAIILASIF